MQCDFRPQHTTSWVYGVLPSLQRTSGCGQVPWSVTALARGYLKAAMQEHVFGGSTRFPSSCALYLQGRPFEWQTTSLDLFLEPTEEANSIYEKTCFRKPAGAISIPFQFRVGQVTWGFTCRIDESERVMMHLKGGG